MTNISIIVAMTPEGIIGDKGNIPWHLPSDLRRFAELTKGHPVIMGRKTYESIITKLGHPLKDRTNIVLTNNVNYKAENCIVARSFNEAIYYALRENKGNKEIFIAGGAKIYDLALAQATKMYVTIVDIRVLGDTYFPKFKKSEWKLLYKKEIYPNKKDKYYSTFLIYKKKEKNFLTTLASWFKISRSLFYLCLTQNILI